MKNEEKKNQQRGGGCQTTPLTSLLLLLTLHTFTHTPVAVQVACTSRHWQSQSHISVGTDNVETGWARTSFDTTCLGGGSRARCGFLSSSTPHLAVRWQSALSVLAVMVEIKSSYVNPKRKFCIFCCNQTWTSSFGSILNHASESRLHRCGFPNGLQFLLPHIEFSK